MLQLVVRHPGKSAQKLKAGNWRPWRSAKNILSLSVASTENIKNTAMSLPGSLTGNMADHYTPEDSQWPVPVLKDSKSVQSVGGIDLAVKNYFTKMQSTMRNTPV